MIFSPLFVGRCTKGNRAIQFSTLGGTVSRSGLAVVWFYVENHTAPQSRDRATRELNGPARHQGA
jgi:hypothetical protein